ncbi:MAG: alpha/beta-hydrolase family protein, partial [Opitutaceae bacterium]|nr:alpha/beta-hydrolase family protein [Opitutaceae bacterium]
LICIIATVLSLVYVNAWQNDLHELMGLPPDVSGEHIRTAIIALLLAFVLLVLARLLRRAYRIVTNRLKRFIPRRISNLLSVTIILFVVLLLADGLVVRNILNMMDNIYAASNSYSDDGPPPENPLSSSSSESLLNWKTLGQAGQNFVMKGPKKSDLKAFFGKKAAEPLRVYAGLRSAETVNERAQLALAELIRIGGFKRSKLIIATPTGTGWHDPSAVDSLEYLHRGDTAIVTMQYSYLPSWLTLLVDPTRSKVSAKALYDAVYDHWTTLPRDSRPDLYIYGLSLGALGAETSASLSSLIREPIQGGVLAGPPFPSSIASQLTRNRNAESTQWLPLIKDSSFVRFTAQDNALKIPNVTWGPVRFVYIQYASDPMVFFSTDLYRRKPDWMKGERGHDVSPSLKWFPIVTFLQLLFDLPMADRIPRGNAHNYAAHSYIDAWVEVTQPLDWTPAETTRLKTHFTGR